MHHATLVLKSVFNGSAHAADPEKRHGPVGPVWQLGPENMIFWLKYDGTFLNKM